MGEVIKKVFAADPLICPDCGGAMRIVAFIEYQCVVRAILVHLSLWEVCHNQGAFSFSGSPGGASPDHGPAEPSLDFSLWQRDNPDVNQAIKTK